MASICFIWSELRGKACGPDPGVTTLKERLREGVEEAHAAFSLSRVQAERESGSLGQEAAGDSQGCCTLLLGPEKTQSTGVGLTRAPTQLSRWLSPEEMTNGPRLDKNAVVPSVVTAAAKMQNNITRFL